MYKKLLVVILLLLTVCNALYAQKVVLYEAKVYTPQGIKKGMLERVYNKGIALATHDSVEFISGEQIDIITVKRMSASYGKKILASALLGSLLMLDAASKQDAEAASHTEANTNYRPFTLTENAAQLIGGSTIGAIVGAVPVLHKKNRFMIHQSPEAFTTINTDLQAYGRYNQLVIDNGTALVKEE